MAKTYKGTLSLDWYNKQQAILLRGDGEIRLDTDVPAPKVNWVNKDEALFYEIDSEGGIGQTPYWVERNDIRVKEARPLILQKVFKAVAESKPGTLQGMDTAWKIVESQDEDASVENILIKGDNLLALNTLKKMFSNKPDEERVKCVYIDPPYNINVANPDYDDNMAHSEWLTLMRDRLILLKEIMREDGIIFVQISDQEEAYLRILLDEIFGRENFINRITVRTKSPSGFQTVNLGVFETAEYIFLYGKNKALFNYKEQFTECEYDSNYKYIVDNIEESPAKWFIQPLADFIAKKEGYVDASDMKKRLHKNVISSLLSEYALKYNLNVFRLTAISDSGAGRETVELKYKSKETPNKILIQVRENYPDRYILNGEEISFYSKKVKSIDGTLVPTIALTNIWTDIAYEGIASEGNVKFPKSKKPEKLIRRILEMSTSEGDIVLDSFLGSGTTAAVAAKLKRKWIGVEIGNHADTHVVPRLKSVIDGTDQSGISKIVSWQGGSSFKYYHLGQSIITIGKDGVGDFNWSLGKKFIEESFLSSYDYILDKTINLSEGQLFKDELNAPSIGIQVFGTKKRVAVITLNEPGGKNDTLTYEEIFQIYSTIKKKLNPEYINIFTNKGLELAYDSRPEDLEVIKVPHAIFSELEK